MCIKPDPLQIAVNPSASLKRITQAKQTPSSASYPSLLPLGVSSLSVLNGRNLSKSTSLPLRLRLPTISLLPRTTGANNGLLGRAGLISGLAPPITGVPPISTLPGLGAGIR